MQPRAEYTAWGYTQTPRKSRMTQNLGLARSAAFMVWEQDAPPSSQDIPCPQSLDTPAMQALPPQAEVVKKTA